MAMPVPGIRGSLALVANARVHEDFVVYFLSGV